MKRAVIYARVSTEPQDNNFSIPSQIDAAKEYARQRGMEVLRVFCEDASGFQYPRPALEKALELIEQGEAQCFIAHDSDGLNRHEINGYLIRARLAKAGGELHFTLAGLCNLDDQLMLMIRDAISADEARRIKERMVRGMSHKVKKQGAYPGTGAPPYGYRVVGEQASMTLEIDEEKARWVHQIFDWYSQGVSVRKIIDRLEANGVARPGETTRRKSILPSCRWTPATIYKILNNEAYVGRYHYGKTSIVKGRRVANGPEEWTTIEVPAIVDGVMFGKVKLMLAQGRKTSRRNRLQTYLLSGMLTCKYCGTILTTSVASAGRKNNYYRCVSYKRQQKVVDCPLPFYRMPQTDGAIWQCVVGIMRQPEILRESIEAARLEATKDNRQAIEALQGIEEGIEQHKGRLQRVISLFVESNDPDTRQIAQRQRGEIERALAGFHAERDRLSRLLLMTQISDESIRAVEELSQRVSDKLDNMTVEQQRAFLEALGVSGIAALEDGRRVIYLRILLTTHRLEIADTVSTTSIKDRHSICDVIPLTFRVVIPAA